MAVSIFLGGSVKPILPSSPLPNPIGCRSQKNRIFENFISPRPDLYIEPKTKNRRRDLGQSLKHISCFWKDICSPCETGCCAPQHFYGWILLPSAQSIANTHIHNLLLEACLFPMRFGVMIILPSRGSLVKNPYF